MPKIVRFHKTGEADVLQVEDLPVTDTGKGPELCRYRGEIMFCRFQYLEVPQSSLHGSGTKPRALSMRWGPT